MSMSISPLSNFKTGLTPSFKAHFNGENFRNNLIQLYFNDLILKAEKISNCIKIY